MQECRPDRIIRGFWGCSLGSYFDMIRYLVSRMEIAN